MLHVHSIETFGTADGPGIRLVVFLQGCQWNCLYCHNPDAKLLKSKVSKEYSVDDILDLLEKQRPYFRDKGGLTVSGGEPTLQAAELILLFQACREQGFHTAVDTNGAIVSDQVKQLYDLADLIILDVKHIDEAGHRKLTGASLSTVLANANYREHSGKPMWLRYVLVPGYNDQPEVVEAWAKFFANYKTVERVDILPYHTLGVHKYEALGIPYQLEGVEPPDEATIERVKKTFEKYLKNVEVG